MTKIKIARIGPEHYMLGVVCIECKQAFGIKVKDSDYFNWANMGMLIQNAFPYLTESQRELLISGVCESCFDKLFSEDE